MHLLINAPAVASSSLGVRRYVDGVLRHLVWNGDIGQLSALGNRHLQRGRELVLCGRRDTILWTPVQRGPLRVWHHVVTVHDCINVEYVHRDDWRRAPYRWIFERILRAAEQVVAISDSTKAALLRNYRIDPDAIKVIRSPVRLEAVVPDPDFDTGNEPFVLMVTNALPHKNALAACIAFAQSRAATSGWALHVVGALPPAAVAVCQEVKLCLRIHPRVTDAALARLYRDSRFLLAPSLSEGHDLPIAEALAHGTRVLCSDIDAHREFYGGAVGLFDPHQVEAIVAAIDAAMDIDDEATTSRWAPSRGFAEVAEDYQRLFTEIQTRALS